MTLFKNSKDFDSFIAYLSSSIQSASLE